MDLMDGGVCLRFLALLLSGQVKVTRRHFDALCLSGLERLGLGCTYPLIRPWLLMIASLRKRLNRITQQHIYQFLALRNYWLTADTIVSTHEVLWNTRGHPWKQLPIWFRPMTDLAYRRVLEDSDSYVG